MISLIRLNEKIEDVRKAVKKNSKEMKDQITELVQQFEVNSGNEQNQDIIRSKLTTIKSIVKQYSTQVEGILKFDC